jgi:hypothetical protein
MSSATTLRNSDQKYAFSEKKKCWHELWERPESWKESDCKLMAAAGYGSEAYSF